MTDTQNNKLKKFARDTTPPDVRATGVWSVWTNDPRHPELIATDPTVTGQYTSGVANIYYSMTGGASWNTYLEPLWFTVQGDNTVTYYAEDAVGNESAQVTGHVYLDTTKPVTTVSGVPAWSKTDVSVTLTPSADGLSPIAATQYRLQGASTWTTYAGPFTVTAEGASTYEYRSYDTAANYEAVKTADREHRQDGAGHRRLGRPGRLEQRERLGDPDAGERREVADRLDAVPAAGQRDLDDLRRRLHRLGRGRVHLRVPLDGRGRQRGGREDA